MLNYNINIFNPQQGVWVLSNRLPVYLYSQLNFNDINFRIQRASVREAVMGTACDPAAGFFLRHSQIPI